MRPALDWLAIQICHGADRYTIQRLPNKKYGWVNQEWTELRGVAPPAIRYYKLVYKPITYNTWLQAEEPSPPNSYTHIFISSIKPRDVCCFIIAFIIVTVCNSYIIYQHP